MGTGHRQHDVGAVTGGDDGDPFGEPLQHVLGGHARDEHAHHLATQQRFVTVHQHPADGGTEVGDRGRHQQRFLGQHIDVRSEVLARLGDGVHLGRVAPVGHHRGGVGVLEVQFRQAQLDHLGDLRGGAVPGPHRQHDRRAEVGRDAGVDAQLAWAWRRRCSRCRRSPRRRSARPPRGSGRRCRRWRRRGPRAAAGSSLRRSRRRSGRRWCAPAAARGCSRGPRDG